ncbi:RimK family alpha-L-glutamate ligase [Candidatus Uhrbacteria bacterium]|nr:RimK family alpha-L-glutamate ligase [Candidatus Uhrbacteria bacterium]
MTIGLLIFSDPSQEQYTGAERFEMAARERGHELVKIYEPFLSFCEGRILHEQRPLPPLDIIISRPNFIEEPSVRTYALQMLTNAGYRVINSAPSSAWAKNKITQHVLFAEQGLPCPRWGVCRRSEDILKAAQDIGFPVVLKVVFGTHGKGIFFAPNAETLQPIAEYLAIRDRNPVIVEEFIEEAQRKDVRVFVLGGRILSAMERTAPAGDVRANTSNGGTGSPVILTPEEQDLAVRAATLFDLEIAGVDIIRSARGPLILEANSNPGFKELERVTGKDIAGAIIDYAVEQTTP